MVILKKITTISKYFFKKNIKDIISFSIILLLATILFSSAIILNNNVSKDYDKEFNKLNTADAFFTIPSAEYNSSLLNDIKNIKEVIDVATEKGIMLNVPVNMDGSTQEQNQIFYNINNTSNINKKRINNENKDVKLGIYLSNYTFIHSDLNLNDKYEFNIDDTTYAFNIKGVVNEMQYGNYTSSVIGEYLEDDSYELLFNNNKDKEIVTISIKASDSYIAYNSVNKYLSSKNINILNKNYAENVKNGRLAICNILILILIAFSSIMIIISLFVSKFKISQSIEEEISNMGALEALGYTSREIIIACIFPYIVSGLLFTFLGIVASYFVLPLLSKVIEMQSGFIWNIKIDLFANIIVLLINLSLITFFTVMASWKIKKLNPINAIRGLIRKENGKNHLEIEKSFGNIHFILMLKYFINMKRQNILLGIVLFFITIIASFMGILFYNINLNPINFINTLVEEHPSIVIVSDSDLRSQIKGEENVKNVIYYDENVNVNFKDNSIKTFVAESFDNLENDLCYLGRNPKNSNEVAIGSKLKDTYDINIGDEVILGKDGVQDKYEVVGFVQSVNYSGEVIEITLDGYKKLAPSYLPTSMYVYLEDEGKSLDFINIIKDKYNSDIVSTMNYAESMDSAMKMYVSLISIILVVMILITLFIIYLILYIIVSSVIMRRKQELGIFKAIGYENKQLVRQLVGGFLPSMLIATILGFIVSKVWMHNIYLKIFEAVGAYKISFEYPLILFLIIVVLIILSTVVIATILARKINKISVYSLIKD